MHRLTKLFLALALVMSVGGLTAGIIDFNGFADGSLIASDTNAGVTVNFYTDLPTTACPCLPASGAYSAHPGAAQTAFQPNDIRDGGAGAQSPFLSDDQVGPVANAFDYFFSFDVGVPDLKLLLLDFRGDGGAAVGATATLNVFSSTDWSGAPLATSFFTVGAGPIPDGNVVPLSVAPGSPIFTARVTFTAGPEGGLDIGTGIDDLEWTTVPEPGTVVLFGSGLLGLAAFARKRRTRA
jgi:hypothetical protein